jgi:hypothetical protein
VDRSADHRDPPTGSWPSITDYWPDVSADQGAPEPAPWPAGESAAADDGITWIGSPDAAADPGRRRWRLALGGMLAATVLVIAGAVLASLIKQAHETTTTAEPVQPQPAGTLAAPLGPTGAASVAPAPSSASPSASASSSAAAKAVAPALPGSATFELATGSPSVTLLTRDLGSQLYQVAVADDATGDPKISDSGSVHRLTVTHNGKGVLVPLRITLNAKVHWTVRVTGGIGKNVLNFRDSDLTAIELAEGASSTQLALPPAVGTLPVLVSHGVHTLQINPAQGDPVRAQIRSGADKAVVLGQVDKGVRKGTVLTSSGWDSAADRIDLVATGGIGALTVS